MHNFEISEFTPDLMDNMIKKGVWGDSCPVKFNNLRLLNISHYDFAGDIKIGKMIVLDKVAVNVINIFQDLYALKFPIHQVQLMDQYKGDDNLSMLDNNSSAFNYRNIQNSKLISMHAMGLAIDINPVQNPCIMVDNKNWHIEVYPKYGISFLNRSNQRPGMVEPIVGVFKKHGFNIWGGSWNEPIDYHHFQVDRRDVQELLN